MQSQAHSLQDSPMSMATAPQPPEGLAGPRAYTARSDATTKAYLPSQDFDSIQFTAFKRAAVAPKQALTQSTPCTGPLHFSAQENYWRYGLVNDQTLLGES